MQYKNNILWKNSGKAFLILFSGAFLFVVIITIFPLIGSLFLPDFPIWRVIKENTSLLLPLSVFSLFISPVLGFIGTVFQFKRIFWFLIIGIISYWFAVLFVLLVFSNFTILNESLYNVLMLTFWAFAAYSFFSLPILIPALLLIEKWTRPSAESKIIHTSIQIKKSHFNPKSFFAFVFTLLTEKYRKTGIETLSVNAGESILEIGFGIGNSLFSFAEKTGKSGKVTGIDISPEVYKNAQEKIKNSGLSNQMEILCEDAANYDFPSSAFDAVFLCFTLELLSDTEINILLNKCHNALKNQGRIVIVSVQNKDNNNSVLIHEWLHEKYPGCVRSRPINAATELQHSNFEIQKETILSACGLPVSIIKAIKKD